MRKFIVLFLLVAVTQAGAMPADTLPGKMNGGICPDLSYPDVSGKQVTLKEFRGKYVLIDMWGTWCMPCQQEIPFLSVLEEEFAADNIVFVSIAHEHKGDKTGARWRTQVERDQLGGVQLLASDKEFANAVGLRGYPTFLLVDPDGRLLSSDFYRPSNPQCRNVLLDRLRGEKGCDMAQLLLSDGNIRKGILPNGLTWYVASTAEPQGKASFYLVRNAGAVLETDEQNGLAHFLEHMSFNGTEHFPGTTMKETLDRYGVAGLNAYTSHDETVYYIKDVPTEDRALTDSCLLMLYDWCSSVLLDSVEIEAERRVIAEEWRTRRTPEFRMRQQYAPVLYGDKSTYSRRDVIGSLDVIRGFLPEELRNFYHDWYRPDLTAVIAVGDFNAAEMEEEICRLFANLTPATDPVERPKAMIDRPRVARFVTATDAEAIYTSVAIYRTGRKEPRPDDWTYSDLRKALVEQLTNRMLAARAGEASRRESAPALRNSLSCDVLARDYVCYTMKAWPKKQNDETASYRELLRLNEQVVRYGFEKSELKRAKEQLLLSLEKSALVQNKVPAGVLADKITQNFLENKPLTDFNAYDEAVRQILPTISVADAWATVKYWEMMSAPIIVITGPPDGIHLTQEQAMEIMQAIRKEDIQPYQDTSNEVRLLDPSDLKGAPIVSERRWEKMDAVEWMLENGARVVFRHESMDPDDVSYYGISPGGMSLYEPELLPAAREGVIFTQKRFGLDEMDAAELARANTGRVALLQLGVSELYETVNGAANLRDLEQAMQLIYLYFTHPRFDSTALADIVAMNRAALPAHRNNPGILMADSLQHILSGYSSRTLTLNEDYLDALTIDRIEKVFRERFSNAADFTFYFAGNIAEAEMRKLVEKYIGAIPSDGRRERWLDRGVRPLLGKIEKTIALPMQDTKATVVLEYHKAMKYTPEDALKNRVLGIILTSRLTSVIREREGGTYAIGVNAQSGDEPYDFYRLSSRFDCDPLRVEELKSLIHLEIDRLLADGVTEAELKNAVTALSSGKNAERRPAFNIQVIMNLLAYDKTGIDPLDPEYFEVVLEAFTPKDIRAFARKMLKKTDLTEAVFVPSQNI
ncbi:MAG: insulinase family protein [Bacteroidales bacterium]|nr:insulinase family protein [Bacteroidales bacterium]MDD3989210.1 insulinase family protein [Bacteroidales bacterium]